jgi:hypothetical protein
VVTLAWSQAVALQPSDIMSFARIATRNASNPFKKAAFPYTNRI